MTTNIFGTVANIWLLFNGLMRFLYISIYFRSYLYTTCKFGFMSLYTIL